MPFIAAFTAAEAVAAAEAAAAAAAAAETTAAATTAAEAVAAAEAAQVAQAAQAAQATQAGIMGAQAAGAGATGAGIVAEAAPAIDAATAIGGQGAGSAATQAAMQSAMQTAGAAPGGITAVPQPAGVTPLTPAGTAPLAPAGELSAQLPAGFEQQLQNVRSLGQAPGVQLASATPNAGLEQLINPEIGPSQPYTLNPNATPAAPNLADVVQPAQVPPGAAEGPTAFDKFSAFAGKHPFMTGAGLYLGASTLGLLDQKGAAMPEKKSYGPQYRLSENFQAAEPEANVYTPSYPQYAEGGVMAVGGGSSEVFEPREETDMAGGGVLAYAKGGTLSDTLDFYKQMAEGRSGKGATAPKADADVGIYYDQDPDTRYQDALTAAQIRQAKLNKRSNMQVPTGGAMRRPTPMGQINLAPPGAKEAAQGGIMQAKDSSLGGYAAGGNPRLLKGPGDGMSDNIPAMIGRKQPARLADGEFVIPADVVSHLGNGSTEAGAKRLHEMMNKVRQARTGNPKQGKQINPKKYMPA